MKVPNPELLAVEREKVVNYLLNLTHRVGGPKAVFFYRFGFRSVEWEVLAEALKIHGRQCDVRGRLESVHGIRYEVDGVLDTPDGRQPIVRTVRQIDEGSAAPRLITAYPLEVT